MFKKKQKIDPPGRNVRPQQTANVFSYYASRSPADQQRRSAQAAPAKQRGLKLSANRILAYMPSLVAGLILVICLVYISTLDGSPKLQVVGDRREVGLLAGTEAYQDGVGAIFGESLASRSKLLINTDEIARKIREKYPELGEVAVILPLVGRRPVVQIQPAEPALLMTTLGGGYVIDENGRAIADARDVESSIRDTLPILQDESGLDVDQGNYALPADSVTFVRMLAEQLRRKELKVQTMTLPTVANELHLRLADKPYYIKLDIRGDSRVQAGTLIATKEKLEADKVTPREYLDVRVPGKAYYK